MNDFPGSSDDERMRRLLNDAVSDVEPRGSLDEIRGRTASTGSARRAWILGAGAAVVATAATISAVAMLGGSPGTTNAPDPGFADKSPTVAGTGSPEPSQSATERPPSRLVTVPVYYVGETSRGPRLFREFSDLSGDPLSAALSAAVGQGPAGEQVRPADPDYRSSWPALTDASGSFDANLITINLGGDPESSLRERPAGLSEDEARVALEQLIYTAQGVVQERAPVRFLLYGERTDTVLGVPVAEPLAQGDPADVLAQVWIIDPAEDARVRSGSEVSGLANAFEANVQWELMRGEKVAEKGFTMAEECCTMAPYSFILNAPPGDYTLVVHDSDPSGGEGSAPWQDTKNITIVE